MDLTLRPLERSNLKDAERIMKLAFGTRLGIPQPEGWRPGTSLQGRLLSQPDGSFGAFSGDKLVGVVFSIAWGSFGFFGPLCVLPEHWGQGIAQRLLDPVMEFFSGKVKHEALFTFSESVLHISLYQKFGYAPRFLTVLLTKRIEQGSAPNVIPGYLLYSSLSETDKATALSEMRGITAAIYPGLDATKEVIAVDHFAIGDTILVENRGGNLVGFGVCHCGEGSEAEAQSAYIKFAAASFAAGSESFANLVTACELYATTRGANVVTAGTNTARVEAYQALRELGFKNTAFGIAMHKPNEPAYDRSGVLVVDDLR